jgi:hypothetical protein
MCFRVSFFLQWIEHCSFNVRACFRSASSGRLSHVGSLHYENRIIDTPRITGETSNFFVLNIKPELYEIIFSEYIEPLTNTTKN